MKLIKMDGLIDELTAAVARDELSGREYSIVKRYIMRQDAVDAVEVVHGRWANNGISELMLCKCTVCGFPCSAYAFNYCPNCGAKMDGDENGTLD